MDECNGAACPGGLFFVDQFYPLAPEASYSAAIGSVASARHSASTSA